MNKRIKSLLLCFVMIFSLLFTALPAFAVPGKTTTLTVTPDKATASPGETVTYTVTLGAVEDLLGIKFKLIIPEGLTFVTGAAKTGVKEALGATSAEFTPSTKVFLADPEYTSASDLDLMTFECTVDSSASGNLTVQLYIDDPDNYYDSDGDNIDVQVTNATITVTAAPKPATGISLSKSTLELTVGASETLVATVTPADTTDTVTWDTGSSDVATVDSTGKVTAVATGTATITAKAGSQSASCVVTVENAPCTHTSKTNIGEKSSTCKERGWDAYSKCNDCGQLFDKDGNKINAIPYRTLADHTYGTLIEKVDAVHTSTELKAGTKAHYKCSVCEKLFDEGKNEVTAEDLVIPAPAHSYADTWSKDGTNHWKECTCGAKKDIAKHSFKWVVDEAATEEATGLKHEECVCGEERNTGTVIPKLDHTHNWVETKAEASTCKKQGNNQYFYCTKCKKYYKADKVTETTVAAETLELAAHTATAHAAVEATCTKEGNIAYWTCSVCEKYFSDEACTTVITKADTVVNKKPHSYDESKWVSGPSTHWHACSVCGDKKDEAAHTYGTDNKCTECGYAKPSYSGGGYIPPVQKPTIEAGEGVKVTLSTDGTVATITVDPAYELADVVLNGTSKGKVTEVKGLKTGDKLVVTAAKKAAEPTKEDILAALADQKLVARSKVVTMKNGKKAVRITWYNANGEMMDFDGVQIFRSVKKNSGYGKKPIFTSETDKYYNTAVKVGTKYYYKVRGFVVIDGQKYYTDWSLKAWRAVK